MLLPFLKELLNSTKPLHVMVGALFLMMGGALQHVYAQQEKMSSNKADTLTIAQMLEQNKELIELQRQAQELQQSQHALATSSLLSLESRMLQADARQSHAQVGYMQLLDFQQPIME